MKGKFSSGSSCKSRHLDQETSLIAAVDIGGTKISVGIIDGEGKVLARLECPTHPDRGYAEALRRITEMLRAAAETAHTSISGIGITSCPNSLSTRLTQGECIPVSNAIRLCAMAPNTSRMAFGVVPSFCSRTISPVSSNTQYQLDRSPRSRPIVTFG